MAKVSVMTPDRGVKVASSAGFAGNAAITRYFDGEDQSLRLHRHDVQPGGCLEFLPAAADRIAYVWQGSLATGDHRLAAGSSFIVEHGAGALVRAGDGPATLLTFAGATAGAGAQGHVRLLPTERVPRADDLGGSSGVGGGIHADAQAATNSLWLHENHMPGSPGGRRRDAEAGIHSHSEDEIIFVTAGEMRLGARLFGSGTAVRIAADTLYSFTPGPEGISFINFRAGCPSDIRFANGRSMSETGYWRDRLPRPSYIDL